MTYSYLNNHRGISALERTSITEEKAKGRNKAFIVHIAGIGEIYPNGKCEGW